ncbi:ATP-binding SpoIIE family protein phosphatase [Arenibaculum sp.]|uniref:ATP-binding SpoIIE family protein phosphatase n=1 Tax=Arenibaculum sp. TaxID=2865862 RepID=UPI002E0F425B|nr:ATP-binding SpoIIE family protein phosphatase [Arenibaculum sp.]
MITVEVREQSQVAEARRRALSLAENVGFGEQRCGRLAIVVTEAATNILRHGGGGEILLSADMEPEGGRVDVIALDKGPGMANVQESMRDGVSTAEGPGTGLGAIRRQSDHCDVYSRPGQGTAIVCGVAASARPPGGPGPLRIAGVCLPRAGETLGGDGWAVRKAGNGTVVLLCDGLGHGVGANTATVAAKAGFQAMGEAAPGEVIADLHERLRRTRGAAVAVVRVDPLDRRMTVAGVGNISGLVRGGASQMRTLSQNGVVGHNAVRIKELEYAWEGPLLAVFHSDGLSAKWDLEMYQGLATRQPMMIAAVLYRDFKRERDDNLVVVMKTEDP